MKLSLFKVSDVEIQVDTKESSKSNAKNDIALVIPAATEAASTEGYEVAFWNSDSDRIVIWFPEVWYQPNYAGGGPVVTPMELNPGESRTLRVDNAKVKLLDKDGRKETEYQVFSRRIREYAVGDSPPTMVFKP